MSSKFEFELGEKVLVWGNRPATILARAEYLSGHVDYQVAPGNHSVWLEAQDIKPETGGKDAR